MTIAKRLLLLMSPLLVALILVGALGGVQMQAQSRSVHFINSKVVPSLATINEIETNFAILRSTVLRHILSNNSHDMSWIEKEIRSVRQEIDTDLEKYQQKMIIDSEDRKLFLDGKDRIKAYYSVIDQVIPLSRSFQSVLAAEKIYVARPMIDAITRALDKHSDYTLRLTNDEGAKVETRARRDGGIILGVLLTSMAIALCLSFATRQRIVGLLHNMTYAMSDIAANRDLTRRVVIANQDETADTARAFNVLLDTMQDSLKTVRTCAEQVNASSSALSFAAQQVSDHAIEQSRAASNMAAAAEELAANIGHVSERAGEVNTLTVKAGTVAEEGISIIELMAGDIRRTQSVVVPVAESVIRFDEDNGKVSAIVSTIRTVADRMGAWNPDQGDERAAEEIRVLAECTVKSAQDIATIMTFMQTDTDRAIDGTLEAIAHVEKSVLHAVAAESAVREIASGSRQTVLMVDEIAKAIRKQSEACEAIARQVEHVAHISEENTEVAQNAALHSKELQEVAQAMQDVASSYKV